MLRHGMTTAPSAIAERLGPDEAVPTPSFPPGLRPSVLMIACAFPPTSGSGVQRPAKFAKYLHRLGWRVRVWCGKELPRLPRDESLARDLPGDVAVDGLSVWNVPRILANWTYPDERIEWVARSLPRLVRRVRQDRPDVIWSTYSPASNHLLGWAAARATGLPWVADFRDLWTADCTYTAASWWRKRLDVRLERFFVGQADAVVAVSDAQRKVLATLAPRTPEKFFTITNGVDTEDIPTCSSHGETRPLKHVAPVPDRGRLVVAHVGRLEAQRFTPEHVAGFQRFAKLHPADIHDLEFRFVGQANPTIIDALVRAGFSTHQTGHVDHATAVAEMRQADVLLLPGAHGRNAETLIPGKTFEYLASGRPIWLIGAASSEVWQRLAPLGAAVRSDANAGDIAATLATLVEDWRSGSLPTGCSTRMLAPYHRATLAGQLAHVLTWAIQRRIPLCVGETARRAGASAGLSPSPRPSPSCAARQTLTGATP